MKKFRLLLAFLLGTFAMPVLHAADTADANRIIPTALTRCISANSCTQRVREQVLSGVREQTVILWDEHERVIYGMSSEGVLRVRHLHIQEERVTVFVDMNADGVADHIEVITVTAVGRKTVLHPPGSEVHQTLQEFYQVLLQIAVENLVPEPLPSARR